MSTSRPMISSLIELPYGFAGKIFRSPMPFGFYDLQGSLLRQYANQHIASIVMLLSDHDSKQISGFDLRQHYLDHDFKVIQLPIPDYGLPQDDALRSTLNDVISQAQQGNHQVVHCHAGIGRTGLFLACLAIQVFDFVGNQAIHWVRQYVPGALETNAQIQFVSNFLR